jgi:hypothetical protein
MRFRMFLGLVLCAGTAYAKGLSVREVVFETERPADGKKRPNQVKETYQLDASGVLHYSAYFGGMPTDMNHMDQVDWQAGKPGKAVLAAALRLAGDPRSGLVDLPDSESAPDPDPQGSLVVGLRKDDADSTSVVKDRKSKAWKELGGDVLAMIARFEKQTGRPKKPSQLPQGSSPPPPTSAPPTPGSPTGLAPAEAVKRALDPVNAALDKSYAAFATRPGAVAPPHKGDWTSAAVGHAKADGHGGFRIDWIHAAPAGFEYSASATVDAGGNVRVTKADASYSPD